MSGPDATPSTRGLTPSPVASWGRAVLLVLVVAGVVLAFFLSIHVVRPVEGGVGWDTVEYTWRTTLARSAGVEEVPADLPFPVKRGRPAYPVVAGAMSSLTGLPPMAMAVALPPVLAAALGLAAAALCSIALGLDRWSAAFVGVFVGLSANAVLMVQYAYLDNLMLVAAFVAATALLAASGSHRGAVVPATILLAALALIHRSFFVLAVSVVLLAAVALLPASWSRRRSGSPLLDTPSALTGGAGIGALALGSGAVFGLLPARTGPAFVQAELAKKLAEDLPSHRLPVTLPLAGAGAVLTTTERPADGRRDIFLALLLAWAAVVAAGAIAAGAGGLTVPVNRLLIFALPIPILGGAGLILLAKRLGRRRPRAAVIVAVAALGATGALSLWGWLHTEVFMDVPRIRAATRAAGYLSAAGVERGRPIVFVVEDAGADPALGVGLLRDHLLAGLPPGRFGDVHVYLGTTEDYLGRRPTDSPRAGYSAVSRRLFEDVEPTFDRDPVALVLHEYAPAGYRSWTAQQPRSRVSPGVAVLRGPAVRAAASIEDERFPLGVPMSLAITLLPLTVLVTLAALGVGWTLAATRRWARPLEIVSLAPAVGIAVLVCGGLLLERAGLRVAGPDAPIGLLILGALGWIIFAVLRRRGSASTTRTGARGVA